MDKTEQLQNVIGRLSPQQTTELARAVELERALGRDGLPSTPILEALRPSLRVARPPRVPTLQRLICAGVEDFLTDRADDPRLEGLIPRSSLKHWWQAIRFIAGAPIDAFEAQFREQLSATPANLDALQAEAQEAAACWTAMVLAELAKPKPPLALRKLLPQPIARDAEMIGRVLGVAQPLGGAMKALQRIAARLDLLQDGRITDLSSDCVTLLKQQFLAISDRHGVDARFLPLAVLNRLVQPREILRLGRALSWKANDALVANTEFFCVGARLIGEVERLARALLAVVPRRGPLPSPVALGTALVQYLDESEGVLSEIGVRRDSPWGAAILQTRSDVADALDSDFLDRYAQLVLAPLPISDRHRRLPELAAAPSPETLVAAHEAAAFLRLLVQRGQRHGFAKSAHETLEHLAEEIEDRVTGLCEAARQSPLHVPVIEAQARAAAELSDVLFEDGRSETLMKRVIKALRAPAA
ncbi:MAG TPA: hypothetical protein VGL83_09995 [Stellaceae bacterium]|jgi:hypothetical protein